MSPVARRCEQVCRRSAYTVACIRRRAVRMRPRPWPDWRAPVAPRVVAITAGLRRARRPAAPSPPPPSAASPSATPLPVGLGAVLADLPLAGDRVDRDLDPDDPAQHRADERRRRVGDRPGLGAPGLAQRGEGVDLLPEPGLVLDHPRACRAPRRSRSSRSAPPCRARAWRDTMTASRRPPGPGTPRGTARPRPSARHCGLARARCARSVPRRPAARVDHERHRVGVEPRRRRPTPAARAGGRGSARAGPRADPRDATSTSYMRDPPGLPRPPC